MLGIGLSGSYLHRNRTINVRFSLRDLGEGSVRRNETLPAWSFFCEMAEQDYIEDRINQARS